MHSPERVAANVELAGVVAEDDDIGEEAVVDWWWTMLPSAG